MNFLVLKAYLFSKKAHKNQRDKGGKKYINHPLRVSKRLSTTEGKIVGLLHDVVEDTKYNLDDIEKRFGHSIAHKVDLLTHREGVSYSDYIDRLMEDETCILVKLSDLIDNMNIFRLRKDQLNNHMMEKYDTYCKAYLKLVNTLNVDK